MKHKEHLRDLLVSQGLVKSTAEAERLILAAQVRVDGEIQTQAGALIPSGAQLELLERIRYVSRGGLKLEGALEDFAFDPSGLRSIDVGASSGGFTDCLLQRGAASVVAVDVGYGQFDWKLRVDKRVRLYERTNIAKADPAELGAPFELLVADLSFTSLARLASRFSELLGEQGQVIALVKPQFELPRNLVEDGIVRSPKLHVQALSSVLEAYKKAGLMPQGLSYSPLLGAKGNTEFWIWAAKRGAHATIDATEVVRRAHQHFFDRDETPRPE